MERRDGKSQHHPRADPVQKMEMMQQIWALKREHKTFVEIAEIMGISDKTAWKYFHEYENWHVPPNVEQDRLLHIEQIHAKLSRLEGMLDRYAADPEMALKIMAEMRNWMKDYRRFMNMEGAKNVRHTVQSELDAEIRDLQNEFAQFDEGQEDQAQRERAARKARFDR